MSERARHLNVEHEYEKIPTAISHFRNMVTSLKIAKRQPSATGRREAMEEASFRATRVLTSPYEEREVVGRAFDDLRQNDPQLARMSLRTLRSVNVFGERSLRRFLGLPTRGRIFPRS